MIRASIGNRAKESLVVDFINQADLDQFRDKASIIEAFFAYAQAEQKREAESLIQSERLNEEAAKRIESAVRKVLAQGLRTADIYETGTTKVGTVEMGDAVLKAL